MSQISEDILIRFISNSYIDEDLKVVRAWIEESDENSRSLFEMEQIATLSTAIHDDRHAENRLREEIRRRIIRNEIQSRKQKRKSLFLRLSGAAAVFAAIFTVGYLAFRTPRQPMIYVAATDESISVVLPDSSVVFLNRNSQLAYPEHFADNHRRVELTGEGFFEVSHDRNRPFTVVGPHLSVEVLGTLFNFVSNDSACNSVSLLEGSVEVMTDNQAEGVVLEPGQKAIYSVDEGRLTVQDANVAIDAVWHDRLIPFENANMVQIVEILNQLYDVDIELDGSVDLSKTYSGLTVYYGNIDSTLTRLTHTLPIRFSDEGDKIVIRSK